MNEIVLYYVGNLAAKSVPPRDLTADDLEDLEEYCAPDIAQSPFKTLREFLLASGLYTTEKADNRQRGNKILLTDDRLDKRG